MMRVSSSAFQSLIIILLTAGCCGLQVSPGSPCSGLCLKDDAADVSSPASSTTGKEDIVCKDVQYGTKTQGKAFKGCVECLEQSSWCNGTECDLTWLTYNLRFAVYTCLFDEPRAVRRENEVTALPESKTPLSTDVASSTTEQGSCGTGDSCLRLKDALGFDGLDSTQFKRYGFCDGSDEGRSFIPCAQCLRKTDTQTYLSNFMMVLQGACAFPLSRGSKLRIDGDVFSSKEVDILAPIEDEANGDKVADGGGEKEKTEGNGSKVSKQATVGIIAGVASVATLLVVAVLCLLLRHRRQQKRFPAARAAKNVGYPREKLFPGSGPFMGLSGAKQWWSPQTMSANSQEYGKPGQQHSVPRDSVIYLGSSAMLLSGMPVHPAYNPHIRSSSSLAGSPAVAAEGSDSRRPSSTSRGSRYSVSPEDRARPVSAMTTASRGLGPRPGVGAGYQSQDDDTTNLASGSDSTVYLPVEDRPQPPSRASSAMARRSRSSLSLQPRQSTAGGQQQQQPPRHYGTDGSEGASRRGTPEVKPAATPRSMATPSPAPSVASMQGRRGRRKEPPRELRLSGTTRRTSRTVSTLERIEPSPQQ